MCQRRPADPTDPGDAADLSIMGYLFELPAYFPKPGYALDCRVTVAQEHLKINSFLTNAAESLVIKVNSTGL